jgi:hypothetical protein
MDVPSGILAQLGLKHNMLYEHLQQDRSIKQTADNYPSSVYTTLVFD